MQLHDETTENVCDENKNSTDIEPGDGQKHLYSRRERKPSKYLDEYLTDLKDNEVTHTNIDYSFGSVCGVPQIYSEAQSSLEASRQENAMREELHSFKDNETFDLTPLPEGRNVVGGK